MQTLWTGCHDGGYGKGNAEDDGYGGSGMSETLFNIIVIGVFLIYFALGAYLVGKFSERFVDNLLKED